MEIDGDAEFMTRRALLLLLSDLRNNEMQSGSIAFRPLSQKHIKSIYIPQFRPLIMLLNLWIAFCALRKLIRVGLPKPIPWSSTLCVQMDGNIRGNIDWGETFKLWVNGQQGHVIRSRAKLPSRQLAEYVAFILQEASLHAELICKYASNAAKMISDSPLLEMIDDILSVQQLITGLLKSDYQGYGASYKPIMDAARILLANIVENPQNQKGTLFEDYNRRIQMAQPQGFFNSYCIESLTTWRRQYLACNIWLGDRVGFEFHQKGDIAHLYEMWCFYEFVSVVRALGYGEIIQRQFISRHRSEPDFQLGDNYYALYDCRTARFKSVRTCDLLSCMRKPALSGVFVEWFIANLKNPAASIIIDAKYSDWRSAEMLKVIGYMANYGVRRGAAFVRGHIPSTKVTGGEEIVRGLRCFEFPGGDTKLWIANLKPEDRYSNSNSIILKEFIKAAL